MSYPRPLLNAPSPPEFGEPLGVEASAETIALLARRRSTSASALSAPGPDRAEVETLLRLGARTPDHGKLSPWRFIVLQGEPKAAFVERLREIAQSRTDTDKALGALNKAGPPPLAIAVISRPVQGHKVPVWEQELSAGAVCMNLQTAANAGGWGANWITDWYSFDADALALLGAREGERVSGFIYVGTPSGPSPERGRPDLADMVSTWEPKA